MKRLLVIIDGMDDEPNPILGNLTPSYYASMPALKHMREHGVVSRQNTIPHGNTPATEGAVLKILGYDVPENLEARAWLEALGCGINVSNKDLCLRCNLITHADGRLVSHCGGDVTGKQCSEIVEILNMHLGNDEIEFFSTGNFKNLMVVHNADASIRAEAPHTLIGKPLSHLNIESVNRYLADSLNRIIIESRELLKSFPANGIALWAPGRAAHLSDRKIDGTLIAGVNVMKGIGKTIGMDVPDVEGATGDEFTDYHVKFNAALNALEKEDFVILHIEAPDEASHLRDVRKKVRILEDIDREILTPLLGVDLNLEITVQSDHATSSVSGLHLGCPVEVVKYRISNQTTAIPN